MGSWGVGKPAPCIACPEDLMLYALALRERLPSLPENFLSRPHPEIELPPAGNQQLMVEPFFHVARSAAAASALCTAAAAAAVIALKVISAVKHQPLMGTSMPNAGGHQAFLHVCVDAIKQCISGSHCTGRHS